MGRAPCCEKVGLKKGPWTAEEDEKLVSYIQKHGHGSWRSLPKNAGLLRCGKSCRLRWTNYLRPDIKRGKFSDEEDQTILNLHAILGNKWSSIASHLPGRTDNEIKNYWNTHLKKRLLHMGLDPVSHKPLPEVHKIAMSSATLSSCILQHHKTSMEADSRLHNLLRQIPHIVTASSSFYGPSACSESSGMLQVSQHPHSEVSLIESSNTLKMHHQYQQEALEKLLTNSSSSSVVDQLSPTSSLSLAECSTLYSGARLLTNYCQHTSEEVKCESNVVTPAGSVLEFNTDENNCGESKPQGNLISPEHMTSHTSSSQSEMEMKNEAHLVYGDELDELVCTPHWSLSADPLGLAHSPLFDTSNQEISAKQISYKTVEQQMIPNPVFRSELMLGRNLNDYCDIGPSGVMPMLNPEAVMDLHSIYRGTISPSFSLWQDQSIYSIETGSQNYSVSSVFPSGFPFQSTHHKIYSLPS